MALCLTTVANRLSAPTCRVQQLAHPLLRAAAAALQHLLQHLLLAVLLRRSLLQLRVRQPAQQPLQAPRAEAAQAACAQAARGPLKSAGEVELASRIAGLAQRRRAAPYKGARNSSNWKGHRPLPRRRQARSAGSPPPPSPAGGTGTHLAPLGRAP